jgi:hypothetical protein
VPDQIQIDTTRKMPEDQCKSNRYMLTIPAKPDSSEKRSKKLLLASVQAVQPVWHAHIVRAPPHQTNKSFLVLFYKKEHLSS